MIYPLVRWTLISPEDQLLTCQHYDRYDFEAYRHELRKKIKKEYLEEFDREAHHVRLTIRIAHGKQHTLYKLDHISALREALKFGANLRKNLYYLDDYLCKQYMKNVRKNKYFVS